MKSYFITGTDTDVGKTIVTAGLARALRNRMIDVGIMKPFAAGSAQKSGFRSEDVEFLAKAAGVNDSEELLNPQFFSMSASPYTAFQSLGEKPNLELVLSNFIKLSSLHQMLLVEGMGGIMTPITQNYFVADLIKEMKLDAIIISRSRIGTVNHTIMTSNICKNYKIPVKGIIINNYDKDGYELKVLKRDLESLTGIPILGFFPFFDKYNFEILSNTTENEIDLEALI